MNEAMMTADEGTCVTRPGGDLDPAIRRFVRELSAAWAREPDLATVTPAEARHIAERVRAPWTEGGPEMESISDQHVPAGTATVRVRRYDPGPDGVKPALVYLHGGGWTMFSLDTHDRIMREYAGRTGFLVFGVDFALSPEAKYPVALEQVCAVARYLTDRGGELGADPTGIVLGGDSAGANLAVAAALRLREEERPALPRALVLNYGVFDRWCSPQACRAYDGEGYVLSSEEMETFWSNYLRNPADAEDPLVCPVRADLRGLPPTLLVVPECDVLSEQSLRMLQLLRIAEVEVDLKFYVGATHSFLEAVAIAPVARQAFADTAGWLTAVLGTQQRG
jgi:acetyl esterase